MENQPKFVYDTKLERLVAASLIVDLRTEQVEYDGQMRNIAYLADGTELHIHPNDFFRLTRDGKEPTFVQLVDSGGDDGCLTALDEEGGVWSLHPIKDRNGLPQEWAWKKLPWKREG